MRVITLVCSLVLLAACTLPQSVSDAARNVSRFLDATTGLTLEQRCNGIWGALGTNPQLDLELVIAIRYFLSGPCKQLQDWRDQGDTTTEVQLTQPNGE